MFPVIFDGPASARAGRDEYVQGSAGDKIACPTAKNLLRVQKNLERSAAGSRRLF